MPSLAPAEVAPAFDVGQILSELSARPRARSVSPRKPRKPAPPPAAAPARYRLEAPRERVVDPSGAIRSALGQEWVVTQLSQACLSASGRQTRLAAVASESDEAAAALALVERSGSAWSVRWTHRLDPAPGARALVTSLGFLDSTLPAAPEALVTWLSQVPGRSTLVASVFRFGAAGADEILAVSVDAERGGVLLRGRSLHAWEPLRHGAGAVFDPLRSEVFVRDAAATHGPYRMLRYERAHRGWFLAEDRESQKAYLGSDVAQLDPHDPDVVPLPARDAVAASAVRAMKSAGRKLAAGDPRQARDLLARATRIEPAWTAAWAERARACELAGDADGAMSAYSEAVRLDPWRTDLRARYAARLRAAGDLFAAEAQLLRALGGSPSDLPLLCSLAELYDEMGEGVHSAACYREIVLRAGADPAAAGLLAAHLRGSDLPVRN